MTEPLWLLLRPDNACCAARLRRVSYPSLAKYLCVGGVYVRLLLDGTDAGAPTPRRLLLLSTCVYSSVTACCVRHLG